MEPTKLNLIAAALTQLILTLPGTMANHSPPQSYECSGTSQTSDLDQLRVFRSVGGGNPTLVLTKSVRGREGRQDTVYVDPGSGAQFYATVTDTSGNESCPSPSIFLSPVTAVDSEAVDRLIEIRQYDVHGRRVQSRAASGVYWETRHYLSGRVETKKLVHLR